MSYEYVNMHAFRTIVFIITPTDSLQTVSLCILFLLARCIMRLTTLIKS